MPRRRIPGYLKHKPSGQARVVLGGVTHDLGPHDLGPHDLGPHGSAESKAAYDRIIAEWLVGGAAATPTQSVPTVGEVLEAYDLHALAFYGDRQDSFYVNVAPAMRHAIAMYGAVAVDEFGPLMKYLLRDERLPSWTEGSTRPCGKRRVTENCWISPLVATRDQRRGFEWIDSANYD